MSEFGRGLYRTRADADDGKTYVRVQYGPTFEFDLSEARYREVGYQPEFDALPWKQHIHLAIEDKATSPSPR